MKRDDNLIVVWSGTMSRNGKGLKLVPDRPTKSLIYEEPARIYNKTGKHAKKVKEDDQSGQRGSEGSGAEQPNNGCESGDPDRSSETAL